MRRFLQSVQPVLAFLCGLRITVRPAGASDAPGSDIAGTSGASSLESPAMSNNRGAYLSREKHSRSALRTEELKYTTSFRIYMHHITVKGARMSRQELGRSMLAGYPLWEVGGGTGLSTRNTLFIARAAASAVYGYAHPLTNARFATHCSPRTAPGQDHWHEYLHTKESKPE